MHDPPRIVGFESDAPLAISQVDPKNWRTTAPLIYHTADGQVISVPVGQMTDLDSTPLALQSLVPITTGAPAGVLHDHLWRVRAPAGEITYRAADAILKEALGTLGVLTLKRHLIWAAVRWGSLCTRRNGWRGWHHDAPAVLGITIIALPFVTVVGVCAAVVLALYALLERIVEFLTTKESSEPSP